MSKKGRARKVFNNFETLVFNGSHTVKNTYRCLSCGGEFLAIHCKIMEKRVSCPHCSNYEGCSPMPMEVMRQCQVIVNPLVEPDTYWIDNKGTVYSTIGKWKAIKQIVADSGHICVHIGKKNGKQKKMQVHRLVMEAWGTHAPSPNHIVRHKNDIPNDNHIDNLIWGLCVENAKDKEENESKRMELIKRIHGAGFTPEEISIATKIKLDCIESILK